MKRLLKEKKTLIFNNGINTSIQVFHAFKKAGYPIAHLDNTNTKSERELILKWFHKTPNAIITQVYHVKSIFIIQYS